MKLMTVIIIVFSALVVLFGTCYYLGYFNSLIVGQIPLEGLFTIIGVIVGFSLSQITDSVKSMRRRDFIKKALINELSIIRTVLSGALSKKEKRIPDEEIPFITEIYDSMKVELASFLKPPMSIALIQRTYEEIKKMNLEGRGHIVIAGSLDHIYQFSDFKKLIGLIDASIIALKK